MQEKTQKRHEAQEEANQRKEETLCRRQVHESEKRQKDGEREVRAVVTLAKERFRQQWSCDTIKEAGQRL